jgi:hypothetical protein
MMQFADADHLHYLLPGVISLQPLEYAWQGWKHAYIFTSDFDGTNFDDWAISLVSHVRSIVPDEIEVRPYVHEDVAYLNIDIVAEDTCEIHAAWHGHEIGFDNLCSWVGAHELRRLIKKDNPTTAGITRVMAPPTEDEIAELERQFG